MTRLTGLPPPGTVGGSCRPWSGFDDSVIQVRNTPCRVPIQAYITQSVKTIDPLAINATQYPLKITRFGRSTWFIMPPGVVHLRRTRPQKVAGIDV